MTKFHSRKRHPTRSKRRTVHRRKTRWGGVDLNSMKETGKLRAQVAAEAAQAATNAEKAITAASELKEDAERARLQREETEKETAALEQQLSARRQNAEAKRIDAEKKALDEIRDAATKLQGELQTELDNFEKQTQRNLESKRAAIAAAKEKASLNEETKKQEIQAKLNQQLQTLAKESQDEIAEAQKKLATIQSKEAETKKAANAAAKAANNAAQKASASAILAAETNNSERGLMKQGLNGVATGSSSNLRPSNSGSSVPGPASTTPSNGKSAATSTNSTSAVASSSNPIEEEKYVLMNNPSGSGKKTVKKSNAIKQLNNQLSRVKNQEREYEKELTARKNTLLNTDRKMKEAPPGMQQASFLTIKQKATKDRNEFQTKLSNAQQKRAELEKQLETIKAQ